LTLSTVVTMLWSFALFGPVPSAREMLGGVAVRAGVECGTKSPWTGLPTRGAN
jgi:drug/metabolite transporter (DMT)-like permease